MWPVLVRTEVFGYPITIHAYGLLIGIGAWAWLGFTLVEIRRRGLTALSNRLAALLLALVAAAWLGGRGLHVLLHGEPAIALFTSPGGGFVYYGSTLAVVGACFLGATWVRARRLELLDVLLVAVPLLHAFGRIGCFLAGCCHGSSCELPWAVTFRDGVGPRDVPLHPVQLYEAAGELALFAWLWLRVRRRAAFDGQVALTYACGYALLRIATEQFRGERQASDSHGRTIALWISLLVVFAGTWLWRRLRTGATTGGAPHNHMRRS